MHSAAPGRMFSQAWMVLGGGSGLVETSICCLTECTRSAAGGPEGPSARKLDGVLALPWVPDGAGTLVFGRSTIVPLTDFRLPFFPPLRLTRIPQICPIEPSHSECPRQRPANHRKARPGRLEPHQQHRAHGSLHLGDQKRSPCLGGEVSSLASSGLLLLNPESRSSSPSPDTRDG